MDKIFSLIKKFIPNKIFKTLQPAYHFLLSWFSSYFYGRPSEKIIVIGITGTTGKTTTACLMAETLKELGFKVGLTSTAMFSDGNHEWMNDKKMTMIGRMFTQKILKKMVKNKCQFAIVETTSEGVRQFRHRFINYDHLIFTGLYPEHIDSHGSFENYKKAKGELFNHLKRCSIKYATEDLYIHRLTSGIKKIDSKRIKKTIIANLDDEYANYFLSFWAEEKIGYTSKKGVNKVESGLPDTLSIMEYGGISSSETSISFEVMGEKMELSILGGFNVVNVMNAVCLTSIYDVKSGNIKNALARLSSVPGRLEIINEGQDFTVIVDYAFEPNALEKLYETIGDISHNRVIHVLGSCGGGRDEARRPRLGKIAGEKADLVIITNEDPYDDDPELIIAQVSAGAETVGKKINKDLLRIIDRRDAIKKALQTAEKGDIVLITGKGNEQVICVENGKKIQWDDRKVVREELDIMRTGQR